MKKPKLRKCFIIFLLSFIFIITRFVFLERDLPPWNITYYQPIDEYYYTIPAFNMYHYGSASHQIIKYIESDGIGTYSILQNIFTYVTLLLFGNNYYGLRMASIIASFSIFLIMYFLLKDINETNNRNNYILLLISLFYLIIDFQYLNASIVAEPTIYRLFALFFLIFIVKYLLDKPMTKGISTLMGLLSSSACIFVYPSNFFIIPAVAFYVLLFEVLRSKKSYKESFFKLPFFTLGIIVSIIIYCFIHYLIYDINPFKVDSNNFNIFSERIAINYSGVTNNLLNIFKTNIFRFNYSLLFMLFISLPIFFTKVLKEKKREDLLFFSICLWFFVQCIFLNDYPQRKLIFILPIVILLIFKSYIFIDAFRNKIFNSRLNLYFYQLYFISISILIIIYLPRAFNSDEILKKLNIIILLVTLVVFYLLLFQKNKINKFIVISYIPLLFFTNLWLDIKYVYYNPTFKYKNAMLALSSDINGKVIAGGWSHAMRLYNTSIPLLNPYKYRYIPKKWVQYQNYIEQLKRDKIIDYGIGYVQLQNNNMYVYDKLWDKYGTELIKIYDIGDVQEKYYMGLFIYKKS